MHQKGAQNISELGNTHRKRSRHPNAGATQSYSRHCFQVPPHIEQVLVTLWSDDLIVVWVILPSGSLDNACVL